MSNNFSKYQVLLVTFSAEVFGFHVVLTEMCDAEIFFYTSKIVFKN